MGYEDSSAVESADKQETNQQGPTLNKSLLAGFSTAMRKTAEEAQNEGMDEIDDEIIDSSNDFTDDELSELSRTNDIISSSSQSLSLNQSATDSIDGGFESESDDIHDVDNSADLIDSFENEIDESLSGGTEVEAVENINSAIEAQSETNIESSASKSIENNDSAAELSDEPVDEVGNKASLVIEEDELAPTPSLGADENKTAAVAEDVSASSIQGPTDSDEVEELDEEEWAMLAEVENAQQSILKPVATESEIDAETFDQILENSSYAGNDVDDDDDDEVKEVIQKTAMNDVADDDEVAARREEEISIKVTKRLVVEEDVPAQNSSGEHNRADYAHSKSDASIEVSNDSRSIPAALLQEDYKMTMLSKFDNDLLRAFPAPDIAAFRFEFKNGGYINDYSRSFEVGDMPEEDMIMNAIKMAQAKGWKSIKVRSTDQAVLDDLREAAKQHGLGVRVIPPIPPAPGFVHETQPSHEQPKIKQENSDITSSSLVPKPGF